MRIKAHLVKREPGRSRRNGVMTGEVARALRQSIFQGQFQPGDPLPELHLAKQFGVSQAVVREALASLGHAGLVRRFPNRGSLVTSLTPVEISQHVRLRLMLESTAWLDAAANSRPADFEALGKKLSLLKAAAATGDYFEVAQADLEFHREIWRMAGDATLARILDEITVALFAFVSMRRSQVREDISRMVPEHEQIVEVLGRGDSAEILRVMRETADRAYGAFIQTPVHAATRRVTVDAEQVPTAKE